MKPLLSALFVSLTLVGCQIEVFDPLNTNTVVPDVNARIARKLSVSSDGKTIYSAEKYEYNSAGQLERINGYYRNATGQMNPSYYQTYEYNTEGKLARRLDFNRSSTTVDFRVSNIRNYSYPAINQIVEDAFWIDNTTNKQMVAGRTETFKENGLPLKIMRYYPNSSQQLLLQNTSTYTYKSGRLAKEEFMNPTGKLYNTQEYTYRGRAATVMSFYPGAKESYPTQTLDYDRQGRLIRQLYPNRSNFDYGLSSSSFLASSSYSIPAITIFEYDN